MSRPTRQERRYRKAIEALFLGQVAPALPEPLADHLKGCADCRHLARTLAQVEGVMGEKVGVSLDLPPLEAALAWEAVQGKLALPRVAREAPVPWLRISISTAAAAVLGIALWLGMGLGGTGGRSSDGFGARGQEGTAALELVCIRPGQDPAARPAREAPLANRCALDETLGFSYLNPEGGYRSLALFAVDPAGQILYYLPNPAEPEAVVLESAPLPVALTRTVRLGVNHKPGAYKVIAVFSREPIDFAKAEQLAPDWRQGKIDRARSQWVQQTLRIEEPKP